MKPVQMVALAVGGVMLIAAGSWVSWTIPGTTVPQSGQTLAVLLVGAFLGARLAGATLGLYLLAGGAGVPIFADGASGWAHWTGPTAGYLVGFLLAACLVGWASDRGVLLHAGRALGVMVGAHAVILLLGWARLGMQLGAGEAFASGVQPFVVGGLVKGALAAGVVFAVTRAGWLKAPTGETRS